MNEESRDFKDFKKILDNLVRLGIVTDVDNEKRIARVKYLDTNLPSGWLPVLINRDFIPYYDVPQETELSSCAPCATKHKHPLKIKPYMPKVNHQVLVLYYPTRNADGFILGGIRPWR